MARSSRKTGMKEVPLSEVKDDLSRFLRDAETQDIVITRHGKPAGILIGFETEDDWFEYRLERDPRFRARIERAQSADYVKMKLGPFADVARGVKGNQRKAFTDAGGLKLRGENVVDSYCAIKVGDTNVTFGCRIKNVGDEMVFVLRDHHKDVRTFAVGELPAALAEWKSIAEGLTEAVNSQT